MGHPNKLMAGLLSCLPLFFSINALADEPIDWRTGTSFAKQLQSPAGINWIKNPLRQGLGNLSRANRVAIFLDRRINPDQEITVSIPEASLAGVLQLIAKSAQAKVSYLGPVVYIGPHRIATNLPALALLRKDELRGLPDAARRRLLRVRDSRWDELATPRELVEQLADEMGVELAGIERIPHDLWPAVQLPAMSYIQRMSLVLAGFDLTFQFDKNGRSLRLVSIPDETVLVQRTYNASAVQRRAIQELAERYTDSTVRVTGGRIQVRGVFELHDAVERLLMSGQVVSRHTSASKEVFTLTVENKPVGGVVLALAKQLKLEVEFDPAVQEKLAALVSFKVEKVSPDELFKAALDPVGLNFRRAGDRIKVFAKQP